MIMTEKKNICTALVVAVLCSSTSGSYAFAPPRQISSDINRQIEYAVSLPHSHRISTSSSRHTSSTCLSMALDDAMKNRLEGIRRSYQALTERLGDPDVIANSNLLRQVMKDRSQSEEVVLAFDEYCRLDTELVESTELFQEAGDDAEMREMARSEMKDIEVQLEELETKIKVLLLPKDPNDERNCMLEIRAGTGGSEANIFAGKCNKVLRCILMQKHIPTTYCVCALI